MGPMAPAGVAGGDAPADDARSRRECEAKSRAPAFPSRWSSPMHAAGRLPTWLRRISRSRRTVRRGPSHRSSSMARRRGGLSSFSTNTMSAPGAHTERARASVDAFIDRHVRPGDTVTVVRPPSALPGRSTDVASARAAVQQFNGRKGDYTPRGAFEPIHGIGAAFARAPARADRPRRPRVRGDRDDARRRCQGADRRYRRFRARGADPVPDDHLARDRQGGAGVEHAGLHPGPFGVTRPRRRRSNDRWRQSAAADRRDALRSRQRDGRSLLADCRRSRAPAT